MEFKRFVARCIQKTGQVLNDAGESLEDGSLGKSASSLSNKGKALVNKAACKVAAWSEDKEEADTVVCTCPLHKDDNSIRILNINCPIHGSCSSEQQ